MRKTKCGFTLIELITVMAIMAILSAILVPAANNARKRAKVAACAVQIASLETALAMYVTDYGVYPPSAIGSEPNGVEPEFEQQHNGNSSHEDFDGSPNNLVAALLSYSEGGPYILRKNLELNSSLPDSRKYVVVDPWGQALVYTCERAIDKVEIIDGREVRTVQWASSQRSPFHPFEYEPEKKKNGYNLYSLGPDKMTNGVKYLNGDLWDVIEMYDSSEDGDVGDDINNWKER